MRHKMRQQYNMLQALRLFLARKHQYGDERVARTAQEQQGENNSFNIFPRREERSETPPQKANKDCKQQNSTRYLLAHI